MAFTTSSVVSLNWPGKGKKLKKEKLWLWVESWPNPALNPVHVSSPSLTPIFYLFTSNYYYYFSIKSFCATTFYCSLFIVPSVAISLLILLESELKVQCSAAMAKSSADDEELRRACEAAIEGTKQNIVMSIRVAKSRGVWGKSGKLGRHMAKPRVLAISSMYPLLNCNSETESCIIQSLVLWLKS